MGFNVLTRSCCEDGLGGRGLLGTAGGGVVAAEVRKGGGKGGEDVDFGFG